MRGQIKSYSDRSACERHGKALLKSMEDSLHAFSFAKERIDEIEYLE